MGKNEVAIDRLLLAALINKAGGEVVISLHDVASIHRDTQVSIFHLPENRGVEFRVDTPDYVGAIDAEFEVIA